MLPSASGPLVDTETDDSHAPEGPAPGSMHYRLHDARAPVNRCEDFGDVRWDGDFELGGFGTSVGQDNAHLDVVGLRNATGVVCRARYFVGCIGFGMAAA